MGIIVFTLQRLPKISTNYHLLWQDDFLTQKNAAQQPHLDHQAIKLNSFIKQAIKFDSTSSQIEKPELSNRLQNYRIFICYFTFFFTSNQIDLINSKQKRDRDQLKIFFQNFFRFFRLNLFNKRIRFNLTFIKKHHQILLFLNIYNHFIIKIPNNLSFFGVLMLVLTLAQAINWQGTGNMSQSNLTEIWSYINTNFKLSWDWGGYFNDNGDTTVATFTTNFSNYFNKLWDPAWNVIVSYLPFLQTGDTVLYGYAFRDHWMWYNGIKMNDGNYVSFIIWKDYNCQEWWTLNPTMYSPQLKVFQYPESVDQALTSTINSYRNSVNLNSVWATGLGLTNTINAMPYFKDKGLSVIISEVTNIKFYGNFCAVGYWKSYNLAYNGEAYWGRILLLQMR